MKLKHSSVTVYSMSSAQYIFCIVSVSSCMFCIAGINIYAVIFSTLGGILFLSAVAYVLVRAQIRKAGESLWKIKLEDVVFDSPPTILGQGTFGIVQRATYRGTTVAVKSLVSRSRSGRRYPG